MHILQPSALPFILSFVLTLFVAVSPTISYSAEVTLIWDANNPEPDGYKLYYGLESRNYLFSVDVGNQTSYTISGLTPGDYYFAVTAYNAYGESDYSEEVAYTVKNSDPGGFGFLEIGEATIDQNWKWVELDTSFTEPVVIAKPISFNDSNPAVVRIKNIDSTGFEIRIQEWNYLDGRHSQESVSYIAIEAGSYILPDGTVLEAGKFETTKTDSFGSVSFNQSFNEIPIVVACITTYNEPDAVTGRIKNITAEGFEFRMQEQQANTQTHDMEDISYIACEPFSGIISNLIFEVARTDDVMNHNFQFIGFAESFPEPPVLIADMQTCDGIDTASLRWKNKGPYGVDVKVEEEQSSDSETDHATEVVGYMLFYIEN